MKRSYKIIPLRHLQKAIKAILFAQQHKINDAGGLLEQQNEFHLSRRKFISDAAKAAAVIGIGGVVAACKATPKATQPSIAIIGAGIAGLNAAYILKKQGFLAQVFEGSPRAGGRIISVTEMMGQGLWTEMGGEFIDSTHGDMLQLAKEFEMPLIDRLAESEKGLLECAYFFDGKGKSLNDVLKAIEPFGDQMNKDINSLSDNISFESFSAADKKFDEMSISDYADELGIKGWFRNFINSCYTAEYGLEINEQSAISFLSIFNPGDGKGYQYYGDSDERYSIEGGNSKLTDRLYNEIKNQIQFENMLTAISMKSNKYVLSFNSPANTIKDVEADIVILTLPFSTLREVDIQVPLPEWKKRAINELGMGNNSKLFAGFNSRVWRKFGYAGYSFSDTAAINGYDHTQMQMNNDGMGGYTFLLGGKSGLECGTIPLDVLQKQYVPDLDKIFPGAAVSFNGNFQKWHWPSFPFSKGSYTAFKTGQYTTVGGAAERPIDNLFFAGEHCSYEFQGFMNGGAQTGRKAANAIIEKIKST